MMFGSKVKHFFIVYKRYLYLVCIAFVVVVLYLLAHKKQIANPRFDSKPIVLSEDVSKQSINERVLLSSEFQKNELSDIKLISKIKESFTQNREQDRVLFGHSRYFPDGWVYFELSNPSDKELTRVIENPFLRCDTLIAYKVHNGEVSLLGEVSKSTPIEDRFYPFRVFAFPITVPSEDTVGVLLNSKRITGLNEFRLQLVKEKRFVAETATLKTGQIFLIAYSLTFSVLMLILGGLFHQKGMLYFGVYLLSVFALFITNLGYFEYDIFQNKIGLSVSNVEIFCFFLSNILFHPFGYLIFKSAIRKPILYLFIVKMIVMCNLGVILLFLLPYEDFSYFSVFVSRSFLFLTILNLLWLIFYAVLTYLREGVIIYVVVFALSVGPTILNFIVSFFGGNIENLVLGFGYYGIYFVLLLIGLIPIYEFRKELITKENHQINLAELKSQMETLRESEIVKIGRDLHDNIGNSLATVLGYLRLKKPKLDIMEDILVDTTSSLRLISHNLVKSSNTSFTAKVDILINRFNEFSAIEFNFFDYSKGKINELDHLKLQNIYAVIQELLNNILKHSKAKEVSIQIFDSADTFTLSLEDDGVGFDTEKKYKGIGLKNIETRIKLANASFSIDSSKLGTSSIIEISQ